VYGRSIFTDRFALLASPMAKRACVYFDICRIERADCVRMKKLGVCSVP
jgi:hypothetical protein